MVSIERKVDRYTVKCKKCRSILSFHRGDAVECKLENTKWKAFAITCPICSRHINVMDSHGFLAEGVEPVYEGSVQEETER